MIFHCGLNFRFINGTFHVCVVFYIKGNTIYYSNVVVSDVKCKIYVKEFKSLLQTRRGGKRRDRPNPSIVELWMHLCELTGVGGVAATLWPATWARGC